MRKIVSALFAVFLVAAVMLSGVAYAINQGSTGWFNMGQSNSDSSCKGYNNTYQSFHSGECHLDARMSNCHLEPNQFGITFCVCYGQVHDISGTGCGPLSSEDFTLD